MSRIRRLFTPSANRPFRRYATVGVAQNAFFYGINLLLQGWGWTAWQSMALTYPLATAFSFYANRSWSFGAQKSRGQFLKYALLYGTLYPVTVLLTSFQEKQGIPLWLATLLTMSVAVTVLFFTLQNWVFADAQHGRAID